MSVNTEILPVTVSDIPAVLEAEKEYYSLPWSAASFYEALERDYYMFLKACVDGRLVGYCGLMRSFENADITHVTVLREYRRRGIAHLMLCELMNRARALGTERFTLEVRRSNEGAIALYKGLGFHEDGIRRGYYEAPREDAIIMWTGSERMA